MKRTAFNRLIISLVAFCLLLSFAACGGGKSSSDVSGASSGDSSQSSSEEQSGSEAESESAPPASGSESASSATGTGADQLTVAEKITSAIARNKDTVGWLTVPGSTIDAAVLQYKDNDYYLRLNEDKKYDIFGCYFMDFESTPQTTRDKLSRNNIIYGHSDLRDNKDGPKFSQLFKFTQIDFVRSNPYIYYSTRDEEMVWQVFAVFYTHIDFEYHMGKPDNAAFLNIINEAKLRSEYIIDVPVSAQDKILSLSTCTVNYKPAESDNYRLVVMAKLLPKDASLDSTMEVDINPYPKKS